MEKPLIVHGVEYPKKFLIEVSDNGDVYLDGKQISPVTLAFIGQGICMLCDDQETRVKRRLEVREKKIFTKVNLNETVDFVNNWVPEHASCIYAIGEYGFGFYVGRSGNVISRIKQHIGDALNKRHFNSDLQKYILSKINNKSKVRVELFTGLKATNHYEGMVMHEFLTKRTSTLMNVELTNLSMYQAHVDYKINR